MNISKETVETLESMFSILFFDNRINEVAPENATEMYIGCEKDAKGSTVDAEGYFIKSIGKTLKATKKEITLEWVLGKIGADKIYQDFAPYFKSLLKGSNFNFNCYPTSYGIGVFVAVGFRSGINETKNKIESLLDSLGIQYTTQYSDAMWVFRYRISKSKENIEKISSILKL